MLKMNNIICQWVKKYNNEFSFTFLSSLPNFSYTIGRFTCVLILNIVFFHQTRQNIFLCSLSSKFLDFRLFRYIFLLDNNIKRLKLSSADVKK